MYAVIFYLIMIVCCPKGSLGNSDQVKYMAIQDVTEIFHDFISKGDNAIHAKRLLQTMLSKKNDQIHQTLSPIVVYYETGLSLDLSSELEKLTKILTNFEEENPDSPFRILLKIKDELPTRSKNQVSYLYSPLFDYLSKHISRFESICIDLDQDRKCKRDVQGSSYSPLTTINEIKSLWSANYKMKFESILKIGYSLKHIYYNCKFHDSSIKQADYVIVNSVLHLNDTEFVESYGIFKDAIQRRVSLFTRNVQLSLGSTFKKTVYCRLNITATKIGNHLPLKTNDKSKLEAKTMKKYDNLLTVYLIQWGMEMNLEANVIIFYPTVYTKELDMEWLYSTSNLIPYLKNIPIKGFNSSRLAVKYSKSSSIMLEDVASSGFEIIVIAGRKWEDLWRLRNDFSPCKVPGCRPNHAMYMIDQERPFNKPFKATINELQRIPDMQMNSIIFAHGFKEDSHYRWIDILTAYKEVNTGRGLNSSSLYLTWDVNFTPIINQRECPEKVPLVQPSSISNMTDGFVWDITIDIYVGYDPKIFVTNTLMFLEKCLVSSRNIFLLNHPGKYIALLMKIRYNTEGNELSTLYCDNVNEKINQFYEAIFTWAAVRDFTVLIQPLRGNYGYANPVAWKKLTVRSNDSVGNLMEFAPLFLRRSYNQSKVFGSWTKGMLPCIHITTDKTIPKSFEVNHNFVGITLNFDLKKSFLTREEVVTLLIIALSKFQNVDIILEKSYVCVMCEAINSPDFKINFIQNSILCKKVYIQYSLYSKEEIDCLTRIMSLLSTFCCSVYVSERFKYDALKVKPPINIPTGIVHPDCIKLAHQIVLREIPPNFVSSSSHLICEVNSVPAINNDKETMQDYLDTHFYLAKLFQYAYPNLIEVHFRLKSTMKGENSNTKVKNLLRFLNDVSNYAISHRVNYFIIPAFSYESRSTHASLWTISNYDSLANSSVFADIQATYLNKKPEIPIIGKTGISTTFTEPIFFKAIKCPSFGTMSPTSTIYTNNQSTLNKPNISMMGDVPKLDTINEKSANEGDTIFSKISNLRLDILIAGSVTIVAIVIVLLLTVYIKLKRSRQYLTASEVKDFLNGRQETLQEATNELVHNTNKQITNIFDGLMYQKQYELAKTLISIDYSKNFGEGKFSTLYQSQVDIDEVQKEVIVKVPQSACSKEIFKGFLSEIKLLSYVGEHPNIIQFIGCRTIELRKGVLWIVTEFCQRGSLLDYLKTIKASKTGQINVHDLVRFSLEIARGMEHAFNQNAVHGNLSARRILLTENLTCKISGFSLARRLPQYKTYIRNNEYDMLPWRWMAPETLRKLEFSKESDMWSFGVTLWEIFSLGDTPYPWRVEWSPGFVEDVEKGMRMTIPSIATTQVFELMQSCWDFAPEKRAEICALVECLYDMVSKVELHKLTHSLKNKRT